MSLNSFPNPVNQTLYFNNEEHEVPFTYSIRGRRYEQKPFKERFKLKLGDKWIFEVKERDATPPRNLVESKTNAPARPRPNSTQTGRLRRRQLFKKSLS
jgi:hypothetical protein